MISNSQKLKESILSKLINENPKPLLNLTKEFPLLTDTNTTITESKNPVFYDATKPYDEILEKTNVNVLTNPEEKEISHIDDSLSKEFTFGRNIENKHVIHLCLYRINNVLSLPFLEIYLEKENTEYIFPKKVFNSDIFQDIIDEMKKMKKINPLDDDIETAEDEDEEKDAEEIFLEECIDFFHENITTKEDIEPIYKGFIELDNDKENIFVVFDCTNLEIISKEIKQRWVIVEEILEDKSIFDPLLESHISDLIVRLFKENKILANLKKNRKYLPRPKYLYLCKKVEDKYENVYYEKDEDEYDTFTLIPERVQHEILKEIHLFSENPIETNMSYSKIKRYIIFVNVKNKIKGEINEIIKEEELIKEEEKQLIEEILKEPVIGFTESNIEFWSAKSILYFTQ